jgi:hypothetical protein
MKPNSFVKTNQGAVRGRDLVEPGEMAGIFTSAFGCIY